MKYAGGDATSAYDEIHAPGILEETLEKDSFMGLIDPSTSFSTQIENTNTQVQLQPNSDRPPLERLISVHDFEDVARKVYTEKTYAFYSSAATDLISHNANLESYRKILLRPRILRNVKHVSTKRKILGCDSDAPFFVSPAAMARLAHPDGELAIARGCGTQGIIHTVCFPYR